MNVNRKLILCLLFLLQCVWGFADGCYFPERAVKTIPAIPMQRALLVWRDGAETLIVTSEIDSAAQQLGWIIPLPAVPTEMSKASPGVLKTLSFCCQPRITHDLSRPARYLAIAVALELILLLTWRFQRTHLAALLAVLFLLFILGGMLMPALGSARGGGGTGVAGVSVEKSARVGDYQISVVRAKAADALNRWLDENGCSELPSEAGPAVKAYLNKGWVFVAIRLVRDEKGRNVPHPVRFQFASPEPVYPMRLTALAGGAPRFELFVIADRRAQSSWLRTEFCDRFQGPEGTPATSSSQVANWDPVLGAYWDAVRFHGSATTSWIGHPAVTELLWDGAVLTKLSGTVPAAQMTADLPLRWAPFAAHRDHLYTREGAIWTTLIFALILTGIGLLVGIPLSERCSVLTTGWRCGARKVLLLSLGAIAVASGILYLALPKLPGPEVRTSKGRGRSPWWAHQEMLQYVRAVIDRTPELRRLEPAAAADGLVRGLAAAKYPNQIQGGPIVCEDSPGNITVRKEPKGLVVTTYDGFGRPYSDGYAY